MNTRRGFLKAAGMAALPLSEAAVPPSDLRLWYRQPAPDWNEALPIGNGRLGAMVYGGVPVERLQLNEDTLYSDEPGRRDLDLDVTRKFDEVVALLRKGRYAEAEEVISKNWCGRAQPCYQPMADLEIAFEDHAGAAAYERELDLATAVCGVRYRLAEAEITREVFASHPDQAIILRFSSSVPERLGFRARFTSPHPTARTEAAGSTAIAMKGQAPGFALRRTFEWVEKMGDQWKYPELWDPQGRRRPNTNTVMYGRDIGGLGMFFDVRLGAIARGGRVSVAGDALTVSGATEVLLVLTAATSYNGYDKSPSRHGADPALRAARDLAAASKKPYTVLRRAHVADYQRLFNRVSLAIGRPGDQARLPTDERIERFSSGRDPALAALYFQFGRYLMIAGSRPGTQPLNLQGIWNPHVIPPWASAYTTNINAEMNYWPVEVANLTECFAPMLSFIRELSVNGAAVARNMYRRRGWVVHHNTTIWRDAQPVDNLAMPSFWPMASGWFCQHLWEHWLFTGDRGYLAEEAYPIMKSAAEFYLDWLVDNGRGKLVTPAGNSPENRFIYTDETGRQRTAGICMGPAMDMAIIRELFTNCVAATGLLARDPEFRATLQDRLGKLAPCGIGARGQLLEWSHDFAEREPEHRHVSHLYPLHPGNQITPRGRPELVVAAARTLALRGDGGTGWSRAWKINFWARMEDGNHAWLLVRNLLQPAKAPDGRYNRGGVLPNLFCAHPPFQIDGNFGGAAGIAEMLLASHTGEVHLLPALPDAWPEGTVRGLVARGGFEVAIDWRGGKLAAAAIHSRLGRPCTLRYAAKTLSFPTERGKTYPVNGSLERTA